MKLLNYILTLLLVFLLALSSKSKDFNVSHYYEEKPNNELVRKDTSLLISLQGAIIKIGDEVFISEKRKCYFSLEDYMIFDEYKINKTKITFNLDPDNGDILQVEYKLNNQIYYYRR